MRLPAQADVNASTGLGNVSFGLKNVAAPSEKPVEYDENVILNEWALVGILVGTMFFFYLLGAFVFRLVRKSPPKGIIKVIPKGGDDSLSDRTLAVAPHGWDLLSPEDDKMVPIGTVHLRLHCTRRRLLEAYNQQHVVLSLETRVKEGWRPDKIAKEYLQGFQFTNIQFMKKPVAHPANK